MALVEYTLDDTGRMTVLNDVGVWYRHGLGLVETLLLFAQANGYRGYGRSDLTRRSVCRAGV